MKLLRIVGIVAVLLAMTAPAAHATGDTPHKAFVCKYVGTPGQNETLQTGQNPISVDGNAINEDPIVVGSYFNDQQGRSYVLAIDYGQDEPDSDECPCPPKSTTTTTEATTTTQPEVTTTTEAVTTTVPEETTTSQPETPTTPPEESTTTAPGETTTTEALVQPPPPQDNQRRGALAFTGSSPIGPLVGLGSIALGSLALLITRKRAERA